MRIKKHLFEIIIVAVIFAVLSIANAFNKPDIGAYITKEIARVSSFRVAESAK